jgi:hypothetical protein
MASAGRRTYHTDRFILRMAPLEWIYFADVRRTWEHRQFPNWMSCNISVLVAGEGVSYPCAFGKTVSWAEDRIRKTYNIIGGSVLCDDVGADEADLVEAGKAYRFVDGSIQGKTSIIFSHSSSFASFFSSFPVCCHLVLY